MMKNQLLILMLIGLFSCKKKAVTTPAPSTKNYENPYIGTSYYDILSAEQFSTLNIEVLYMPGYKLADATVSNVKSFLGSVCNKPGGINITQTPVPSLGDSAVNTSRLDTIKSRYATIHNSSTALALYVIVLDSYDSTIQYSFAFSNIGLCMEGKGIADSSGGAGRVSRVSLETRELEHQLGHLMGLVNYDGVMVTFHQDTAHGKHCIDPKCVMHYHARTGGYSTIIDTITLFDHNCLADLHASGGK